ncbi:VOC family protein [Pseudonocardia pini]|uniref:VOC family protein n=1 Tax=Pseudonocardia pini TaxID=2758030 RepID=UPI0015F00ED9|nr:VOC family protein [Pseudonocardia pini]
MGATPKLVHVVLQTAQPEAVRDWYCTVLKAHTVYAGHGLTFLTFDDEHHRIALLEVPAEVARPKVPGTVGMHHTAFTFESLDDLIERYEELAAAGVTPAVPIQHGVTTSLYYRDPDGNFVEMQVDNYATADEATAYMEGPEYDGDPVGPAFDVDRLVAARRAGASVEELTTRAWALSGPSLPDPMGVLTGAVPSLSA